LLYNSTNKNSRWVCNGCLKGSSQKGVKRGKKQYRSYEIKKIGDGPCEDKAGEKMKMDAGRS